MKKQHNTIKVYKYNKRVISDMVTKELKFRGQLVGETLKDIGVHVGRSFVE